MWEITQSKHVTIRIIKESNFAIKYAHQCIHADLLLGSRFVPQLLSYLYLKLCNPKTDSWIPSLPVLVTFRTSDRGKLRKGEFMLPPHLRVQPTVEKEAAWGELEAAALLHLQSSGRIQKWLIQVFGSLSPLYSFWDTGHMVPNTLRVHYIFLPQLIQSKKFLKAMPRGLFPGDSRSW